MITKKDLLVAILCTFCLTATLLTVMPVNSTGTYDAWMDTNHDGRINVLDLIKVAAGLGTSGDPSLNVSVVNFPTEPSPRTILVCANRTETIGDKWLPFTPYVEDYQYVSIFVSFRGEFSGEFSLFCCPCFVLNMTSTASGDGTQISSNFVGLYWSYPAFQKRVNLKYEPAAPYISFYLGNFGTGYIQFSILLYCFN